MGDCIDISMQGLGDNIKQSKERLITTASNTIDNIDTNRKTTKNYKAEIGRKTTVWILQATNCVNCTREDLTMAKLWLKKGNREGENNTITNYN